MPLVERVAGELGAIVSVDTYKPARRARRDRRRREHRQRRQRPARPRARRTCARRPAPRSWSCTRAPRRASACRTPISTATSPPTCSRFLRERIALALARGVSREQLILDPGPDFAKTPAQTIALLAQLGAPARARAPAADGDLAQGLHRRADRPRRRASASRGTLAALAHGVAAGAHIFRVHDVAAAADFLTVRAALAGGELGVGRRGSLAARRRAAPRSRAPRRAAEQTLG